jgi:hypothetical protein
MHFQSEKTGRKINSLLKVSIRRANFNEFGPNDWAESDRLWLQASLECQPLNFHTCHPVTLNTTDRLTNNAVLTETNYVGGHKINDFRVFETLQLKIWLWKKSNLRAALSTRSSPLTIGRPVSETNKSEVKTSRN